MKTLLISALLLTVLLNAAVPTNAQLKIGNVSKIEKITNIGVTISNDSSVKADNVKVTVYAFAPGFHLLGDATQPFEYSQKIRKGEVTKFDLPLDFFITDLKDAAKNTNLTWAQVSKTVSIAAKSSADVIVKLPNIYLISNTITNPDDLKVARIFTAFYIKTQSGNFWCGAPTESLTFDKSVFYVQIEHSYRGVRETDDFLLPAPKILPKTIQGKLKRP